MRWQSFRHSHLAKLLAFSLAAALYIPVLTELLLPLKPHLYLPRPVLGALGICFIISFLLFPFAGYILVLANRNLPKTIKVPTALLMVFSVAHAFTAPWASFKEEPAWAKTFSDVIIFGFVCAYLLTLHHLLLKLFNRRGWLHPAAIIAGCLCVWTLIAVLIASGAVFA